MCNQRGAYKCTSYNPKKNMNVYITCPLTVPQTHLDAVARLALHRPDTGIKAYKRGTTYTRTALENANEIIIMLPKNNFKYPIDSLPEGTLKELNYARNFGKSVWLGYESAEGWRIYRTSIEGNLISGLAGTANEFFLPRGITPHSHKYRFKTEQEFKRDNQWESAGWSTTSCPIDWCGDGGMNHYIGQTCNEKMNLIINRAIQSDEDSFEYDEWEFNLSDIIEIPNDQPEMIDLRKKPATQEELNITLDSSVKSLKFHDTPIVSSAPDRRKLLLLLR